MADDYVTLSKEDRLEALSVAATASGRRVHLLERDVWVVLRLDALYRSAEGPNIVFKGGTSLSKAYGVIKRFSEDIDVTTTCEGFCPSLPKATPPFLKTTLKSRSGGSSPTSACQPVLYAQTPREKSRMT